MKNNDYKITALDGLEAVRKVPGMYIGGVGKTSYHQMLREAIDNSVDEFMAEYCDKIIVSLHKDGSASVEDNGRGIPVYYMEKEKMTALEVVLEKLHAGGKFDKKAYSVSSGVHGVGLSVINSLSARLKAIVRKDGKEYAVVYEKGKKVSGIDTKNIRSKNGTIIRFVPDSTIFKNISGFDADEVKNKLRELSFLCKGLTIEFINENNGDKEIFKSDDDIANFIEFLASGKLLDDPFSFTQEINSEDNKIMVDVALQWLDGSADEEMLKCYTNNIPNRDGGSHLIGFKSALTRTINGYIASSDLPKSLKVSLSGDDIREGLVAVVSIRHPDAKFSSQTKEKLVSEGARTAVESVVASKLMDYLNKNPNTAKKVITRCVNAFKAREAARKAKEAVKKSILKDGGIILPGKLTDCSSKDPEVCEMFIVEGSSAAGSAKQGRNREFQAVLPLRGKVLNIEKSEFSKMMSNKELAALITAIGTGIGRNIDLSKLRYNKVIIMSVDGEEPIAVKKDDKISIMPFKNAYGLKNVEVLTMDHRGNSIWSEATEFIKHKRNVDMCRISLAYGRQVLVTANHSVFIKGKSGANLVMANSVKEGDLMYVGLPKLPENMNKLNFFESCWNNRKLKRFDEIIVRGPTVREIWKNRVRAESSIGKICKRAKLPKESRDLLRRHRKDLDISLDKMASLLNYKQACSISEFELGKNNPPVYVLSKWENILGTRVEYDEVPSILDRLWKKDVSNRNIVKDWILLKDLNKKEVSVLGEEDSMSMLHGNGSYCPGIFNTDEDFCFMLGWFIAEGFKSSNVLQCCIGNKDGKYRNYLERFAENYKIKNKYYDTAENCGKVCFNCLVFRLAVESVIGKWKTARFKLIPDFIFSVPKKSKLAFLKGWFLGDGSVGPNRITFNTSSKFMARQTLWLLGNLGVFARIDETKPYVSIIRGEKIFKKESYHVSVIGKSLSLIEEVWIEHWNSKTLEKYLLRAQGQRKIEKIGEGTFLIPVNKVEKVENAEEYVYDANVPETQRFFCGDGILCHNTDADVDGAHIRSLLLTFFFRQMPQLIENGHIYVGQPPLYRINYRGNSHYLNNDKDLEKFVKEKNFKGKIQRFKGLGEMNPEQLWETTLNPATRKLLKVEINDYLEADRIFGILMGKSVDLRREFIEENSSEANLDI